MVVWMGLKAHQQGDAAMRQLIISALVTAALTAMASAYALEQSQVIAAAPGLQKISVELIHDGRPMRLDHLPLLAS
jgi:hypothetical protein